MNIINSIIKLETMDSEEHTMHKLTFLSLFHVSAFASTKTGTHVSFSMGIGPAEIEWSFRLWLTKTR